LESLSKKSHLPTSAHVSPFSVQQNLAKTFLSTKADNINDLSEFRQKAFLDSCKYFQENIMSTSRNDTGRGRPNGYASIPNTTRKYTRKRKPFQKKNDRKDPPKSTTRSRSKSTDSKSPERKRPKIKKRPIPSPPMVHNNQRRPPAKRTLVLSEVERYVTPSFIADLKNLAVSKPSFFDSFRHNQRVNFFAPQLSLMTAARLHLSLTEALKRDHLFFKEVNQNFLQSMTMPKKHPQLPLPYTNVWTQSPGILRSFESPVWKHFFSLENGCHLYPTQPILSKDNFFSRTELSKSYLLNPPYEDFPAERSDTFFQPLRNHVQHLFELSLQNERVQAVMFPYYQCMPAWFWKLLQDPFVTPIFFLRPVIFLRGSELVLHGVAPFRLVILIFGFYSPNNIYVKNNLLGNFLLKAKLFSNCRNLYQLHSLEAEQGLFISYMKNVLGFVAQAAKLYESHSTFFEKIPLSQPFDLFAIEAIPLHQNNLYYARQCITHPFFLAHQLKVPPKLSRVSIPAKSSFRPLLQHISPSPTCWYCGDSRHKVNQCVRNPQFNQNCCTHEDNLMKRFILESQPLILQHNATGFPTSSQLVSYLEQIDRYAQTLLSQAPRVLYYDNPLFSKSRLHWHYHLSAGKPTCETVNSFLGYNLHSRLGFLKYPYIEFTSHPPSQADTEIIFLEIQKNLTTNKIYRTEEKQIWMLAPIFVIQGFNSIGKWKIRLIHDFSFFQPYFTPIKFRMPTPDEILVKFQGKLCISIDISSAFFNAFLRYCNLLGFKIKNPTTNQFEYYAAQAPIFGHQLSPYICNCLLQFIEDHLERLNFLTSLYMDDFLIAVADLSENLDVQTLRARVDYIVSLFTRCGLIVSPKLEIKPASYFLFIGKYFDTKTGVMLPNSVKLPYLIADISKAISQGWATIKFLDSLRGKLFYLSNYARNDYCCLFNAVISQERKKLSHLNLSNEALYSKLYRQKLPMNDHIYNMFWFFFAAVSQAYFAPLETLQFDNYDAFLTVDASVHTGGAFLVTKGQHFYTTSFHLFPEIIPFENPSSTIKELLAVQKAIRFFSPQLCQFKRVLIINDNKVNIDHILSTTPKPLKLREFYLQFRLCVQALDINFDFLWVPREDMFARVADTLSKQQPPSFDKAQLIPLLKNLCHHPIEQYHVYFQPTCLNQFLPNNLWKQKKLDLSKTLIFLLPPFTEFQFVRALIKSLRILQAHFVLITPDFRTYLIREIVHQDFPQALFFPGISIPSITYPYSHSAFKFLITAHL